MTLPPFTHVVLASPPGHTPRVFVTIQWKDGGNLSLTGVVGPWTNGDAAGSCGQCIDDVRPFNARLADVWERWHLNDMRAGCEHQRAEWNPAEPLDVVSYGLTTEALTRRRSLLDKLAGVLPDITAQDRALAGLVDWFKDRFAPPDAGDPLSGCFEVKKRETKTAGWVKPEEHPRGLLGKPCAKCGYCYGSRWLREEVPDDVVQWLHDLPTSDALPTAWWPR